MEKCFVQVEEEVLYLGFIKEKKLVGLSRLLEKEGIFIGKVERKMPNYNGYIVQLEGGQKGLLDQRNIIGEIKSGDEVLLGLYKKTDDDKLDKYTMNFGIPGKFIVYYPFSKKIYLSKRIPRYKREVLLETAKKIILVPLSLEQKLAK
ncbi:hypothetical protein [Lagierella sp.]|uniref:hypothetical protein n=1 Tax=Lagierella sp. TaxID=2849657 RepID=UPI002602DBB7|nr:hypothetical protein [Lagierella sp.]